MSNDMEIFLTNARKNLKGNGRYDEVIHLFFWYLSTFNSWISITICLLRRKKKLKF